MQTIFRFFLKDRYKLYILMIQGQETWELRIVEGRVNSCFPHHSEKKSGRWANPPFFPSHSPSPPTLLHLHMWLDLPGFRKDCGTRLKANGAAPLGSPVQSDSSLAIAGPQHFAMDLGHRGTGDVCPQVLGATNLDYLT
jgi:hypothetical protein